MPLSGSQKKAFQQALLSAYPSRAPLRQMVSFELEENLEVIAGSGPLEGVIFNLIQWAESIGRIEDLIQAARQDRPNNSMLAAFIRTLERPAPPPGSATADDLILPEQVVQAPISLRLQQSMRLSSLLDDKLKIEVLKSAKVEVEGTGLQPYTPVQLAAIWKALQSFTNDVAPFTVEETKVLTELGLWEQDGLAPAVDCLETVGKHLYRALFADPEIRGSFEFARRAAERSQGKWVPVHLQLHFSAKETHLVGHPWELLFEDDYPPLDGDQEDEDEDRYHLLEGNDVVLTRYIRHSSPPRSEKVRDKLRLLYIAPRPDDLAALPKDTERLPLDLLEFDDSNVEVSVLPTPSLLGLTKYLEFHGHKIHVIHFDGYGTFRKVCKCQAQNHPDLEVCHNCSARLLARDPLGLLAFEKSKKDHSVDWVSSKKLGARLKHTSTRLLVLSSCHSAPARDEILFNGLAPALIRAGIPAVVANQAPLKVANATAFMEGFYSALARLEDVPDAVNIGRGRINDHEWFLPTLYLRDKDENGRLFTT